MKTTRNLFLAICCLSLAFIGTGCDTEYICHKATGPVETMEIDLRDFTGINLKFSGDVFITQGDSQKVTMTAPNDLFDLLDNDVDANGVWDIRFTECTNSKKDVRLDITVPELKYVKVSGSGDVMGQNLFDKNDMELIISGSGNIDMELEADKVEAKISGSGEIVLVGEATVSDLEISGSGDIKAFDLATQDTDVKVRGSGNADVHADDKLNVSIGGSGDVRYKGSPSLDVQITGSGKVKDAN